MSQVGQVIDWQKERRLDAYGARHQRLWQEASADFGRIAAELAGEDQTLYRVLLARLTDAYQRGKSDSADCEHFYAFGWLESQEPAVS